jgi:N6-adenosine-specific RNA methylase IME4
MADESTQLVQFDRARIALAEATRIDEVKQIRDQAEALRQYIRQQKGSFEMQNQAAEIKLRAERRAGEMLREIPRAPGERTDSTSYQDGTRLTSYAQALSDLDLPPMTAVRWQLEAQIPEPEFEKFIAETKAAADELTSRAALGLAKLIKHEEKKQETSTVDIPDGLFEVITIDPPWPYGGEYDPDSRRVQSPYKEMSILELQSLEIPASENCILWLWTTNKFMHEAYHLLEAWGYEPKTILTWYKQRTGVGYWLRGDTEHCILATIGKPVITHVAQSSFLSAKAGEHSQKPNEFYQLVESLCPGRKLEMFSRNKREGWEAHGNQL